MGKEGCHRLRCARRGARTPFLPGSGTRIRRKQIDMATQQRVTLGPLFPRHLAALVGGLMVVAAWVMPIAFETERTARVEAFCFGLLVLTVLFVPRYGDRKSTTLN